MSPFLFVGVGCVIAGLCLGAAQFLAMKSSVNYPTQSWHAQVTGWLWATGLLLRGGVILCSVWAGQPRLDDGSVVIGTFLAATFTISRLADTISAKAPARAWRRMNQMQAVMHCRRWAWLTRMWNALRVFLGLPPNLEAPDADRTAITSVLMALDGDQVVAPNEVPKEWRPPT